MRFLPILTVAALTGCAALKPVGVPISLTHVSHFSQHFGDHRTNYGVDIASVGLRWNPAKHLNVILNEGVALEPMTHYSDGERSCGALYGGREVFTATVSYEVPLR